MKNVEAEKIKKVLDFWMACELLQPREMPKMTEGVMPLNKAILDIKGASESNLQSRINALPRIVEFSDRFETFTPKMDSDAAKIAIPDRIKDSCKQMYTFIDSDYDICYGTVEVEELYCMLYETLKIEDLRVEAAEGTCVLFGMRVGRDGKYVENSYNVSPFVSAVCSITTDGNLDNVGAYKQINNKINNMLKEFSENYTTDVDKLLKKAYEATVELLQPISKMVKSEGIAFLNAYKTEKIQGESNRSFHSELQHCFFIDDLQMLSQLDLGNTKLGNYILQKKVNERIDIKKEKKELLKWLDIKNFPLGKWPSKYSPSLMQQVAINIASAQESDSNPIFSVNGPPGTGKTTLLKEIIADNIVKRAETLLNFSKSDDAFKQVKFSTFYDVKTTCFYQVDESLTKYGMLVVSSNNGAVENITKELPIKDAVTAKNALTDAFEVGNSVDGDIYFTDLAKELYGSDKEYWGIISAPLGKKSNINSYYQKVLQKFVYTSNADTKNNIHEFTEQKRIFAKQLKLVKGMRDELENSANVAKKERELTEKIAELKALILTKEHECENMELLSTNTAKARCECQEELEARQPKKILLFRHFSPKSANEFRIKKEELEALTLQGMKLEAQLKEQRLLVLSLRTDVSKLLGELKNLKNVVIEGQYCVPTEEYLDSEGKTVQTAPVWTSKSYDTERERLFFDALQLHKAFVRSSERVNANIRLISNMWKMFKESTEFKQADLEIAMPELFSTLFLITPVFSSTFASIETMLKHVKKELGLLIVDEAGQAAPHMIAGALYRSKTAIVVGDPLQVEPVVTVPEVIRNMFGDKTLSEYKSRMLSVQMFADFINPYGTHLGINGNGEKNWVGCPLVVHRRCIDPMFSISNEISYGKTMLNMTLMPNKDKQFCFNSSIWIDVQGEEVGRKNHYVPNQGKQIFTLLHDYYLNYNENLPNIYIISPFKSVAVALKTYLSSKAKESEMEEYGKWATERIGTVHTFQGKEADEVIFVLGCGKNAINAIKWVNSNIVNVAVTRAKYRLCVVGDKKLWTDNSEHLMLVCNELEKIGNR